jgi:hypothetical protein
MIFAVFAACREINPSPDSSAAAAISSFSCLPRLLRRRRIYRTVQREFQALHVECPMARLIKPLKSASRRAMRGLSRFVAIAAASLPSVGV